MFKSHLINDLEEFNKSRNLTSENSEADVLGPSWILLARVWVLVISCFGVPGNLLTASTIIHQIFAHQRRQNLHSVSDSCFQQMKIIKEGSISGSSDSSSICSYNQKAKKVEVSTSSPVPDNPMCLNIPNSRSKSNVQKFKKSLTPRKNFLTSRESSPGIQSNDKYSITVESPSGNSDEKEFYQQTSFTYQPKSQVCDLDEVFYDASDDNNQNSVPNQPNFNLVSRDKYSPLRSTSTTTTVYVPSRVEQCSSGPIEADPSSQISKSADRPLARKSLSIRSQSLSLHKNSHTNHSFKRSVMRVEGDTLLILHIILCDFLYCSTSLPHTYYVYGFESKDGSIPVLCREAAFLRYVNAFAEWMTLGLLAIQRCIDLAKPPNARFFRMKSTITFVIGIWILSTLLQLGNLIHNSFGYNASTRKCDVVGQISSMLYFYTLDSLLPCGLMMFGCFSIIFQIVRNKMRLQKFGMSKEMIAIREREMWQSACLILSLLFLFLLCVIPICIFNVLFTFGFTAYTEVGVVLYMIYWFQYGINFVVYVISKRKYRLAYKLFFTGIRNRFKRCCRRVEEDNFK